MKNKMIQRISIGIALSVIPIMGLIAGGMNKAYFFPLLFIVIWNIGEVYAASYYLKKVEGKLTAILKLSIISYLTLGRNAIIVVALITYLVYILAFGWITGWILLIRDIVILKSHAVP